MKIAIDIDDVLADSTPKIIEFHLNRTGQLIKDADLLNKPYLWFLGKTEEEAILEWDNFFKSGISKSILPVVGAKEAVENLSKKHELMIVTGRPYSELGTTTEWIEKHFPKKFKGIYFDNNHSYKGNTIKDKTKSEICIEHEAKILIDDLLRFTNECSEAIQVLLFNRPWNQGNTPRNVTRIGSWKEILNFIDNHEN